MIARRSGIDIGLMSPSGANERDPQRHFTTLRVSGAERGKHHNQMAGIPIPTFREIIPR